ncbi:hypothetical protein FJY94_03310 [Candidatus Kaiserbacteria bacterium]|nr:hypothetical protein [Candidatus Kaiserbacteria bacterium]
MSLYVWLKKSAPKDLMIGVRSTKVDPNSGARYIELNLDPIKPSAEVPPLDRKYVRKLTFKHAYYAGFRADGIYAHKGATARVAFHRHVNGGIMSQTQTVEDSQKISIAAPSLRTLREIYSKVRSGQLKPDAEWGQPPRDSGTANIEEDVTYLEL